MGSVYIANTNENVIGFCIDKSQITVVEACDLLRVIHNDGFGEGILTSPRPRKQESCFRYHATLAQEVFMSGHRQAGKTTPKFCQLRLAKLN